MREKKAQVVQEVYRKVDPYIGRNALDVRTCDLIIKALIEADCIRL